MPMPCKGVTVSKQRANFIRDCLLNCYSITELCERCSISRKTGYKWIDRYHQRGKQGYDELPPLPHRSPHRTEQHLRDAIVKLRTTHPHRGPRKLLDLLQRRHRDGDLPAISTAA